MAQQASIVGSGTQVWGTVSGDEDLVVAGTVEGRVSLTGHLVVEAGGTVAGEIDVGELTVEGTLRCSTVRAAARVTLAEGAVVEAEELTTPSLVVAPGAHLAGRVVMDVDLPRDLSRR